MMAESLQRKYRSSTSGRSAPQVMGGSVKRRDVVFRILFLLAFSLACATDRVPIVEENSISFVGGEQLTFVPMTILHEDPEAAVRAGEPVRIERHAKVLPAWERVALVETTRYYEGATETWSFFSYSGSLVHRHQPYRTGVLLFSTSRRLFDCGISFHSFSSNSRVVAENGDLVKGLEQVGEPHDCWLTRDGVLAVIESVSLQEESIDGTPSRYSWNSVLRVIDDSGAVVGRFEKKAPSRSVLQYRGNSYRLTHTATSPPL